MSITSIKKIIFIHNFNFYGKILIQFKKFNKKEEDQIALFFQKLNQIKTIQKKELKDQLDIFKLK